MRVVQRESANGAAGAEPADHIVASEVHSPARGQNRARIDVRQVGRGDHAAAIECRARGHPDHRVLGAQIPCTRQRQCARIDLGITGIGVVAAEDQRAGAVHCQLDGALFNRASAGARCIAMDVAGEHIGAAGANGEDRRQWHRLNTGEHIACAGQAGNIDALPEHGKQPATGHIHGRIGRPHPIADRRVICAVLPGPLHRQHARVDIDIAGKAGRKAAVPAAGAGRAETHPAAVHAIGRVVYAERAGAADQPRYRRLIGIAVARIAQRQRCPDLDGGG